MKNLSQAKKSVRPKPVESADLPPLFLNRIDSKMSRKHCVCVDPCFSIFCPFLPFRPFFCSFPSRTVFSSQLSASTDCSPPQNKCGAGYQCFKANIMIGGKKRRCLSKLDTGAYYYGLGKSFPMIMWPIPFPNLPGKGCLVIISVNSMFWKRPFLSIFCRFSCAKRGKQISRVCV